MYYWNIHKEKKGCKHCKGVPALTALLRTRKNRVNGKDWCGFDRKLFRSENTPADGGGRNEEESKRKEICHDHSRTRCGVRYPYASPVLLKPESAAATRSVSTDPYYIPRSTFRALVMDGQTQFFH